MMLLSESLQNTASSSSRPCTTLVLRIGHSSSQEEIIRSKQHAILCVQTQWHRLPQVFDHPGFDFVILIAEDVFPSSDDDVLTKVCALFAVYPFRRFDLSFESNLDDLKESTLPGRIVEALSLNRSLKKLTLASTALALEWERLLEFWGASNEEDALLFVNGRSAVRELLRPESTITTLAFDWWPLLPCEASLLALSLVDNYPPLQALEFNYAIDDHSPWSLIKLSPRQLSLLQTQLMEILKAMEKNTTLSSFSFAARSSPEMECKHVYEAIVDLLSINVTLKSLNLCGTALADNPTWMRTIESMLPASEEEEGLRAALCDFARVQPTTTRIIFCGQGFAGKTTLRKTMVDLLTAQSSFNRCLKFFQSKQQGRTPGIEVTSVNRSDLEIFFWDLAGQREYHAFHDLMFPNEQGPSLFFIVCSLVQDNQHRHGHTRGQKHKPFEAMLGELRYWLCYISSNTKKVSRRMPHVNFIFTHIDKLDKGSATVATIKDEVKAHTKELEQEFSSVVKVVGTFFVDARKPSPVQRVVDHAIAECKEIVKSCQAVYCVCNSAKKILARWMTIHPHEPWMDAKDFIRLCLEELPEFQGIVSHGGRRKDFVKVIKAVLFSLHQTGNLIYFKNLGIVLVNLQWFCRDFMGGILEKTIQVSNDLNVEDHKGIWKRREINSILKNLYSASMKSKKGVSKWNRKGPASVAIDQENNSQQDPEQLISIMIQLELCFEVNSGIDLFIPATLCHSKWQTHRRWTAGVGSLTDSFGHLGRRLKCKDETHTFITPGFFPRLQVHLKNVFKGMPYELQRDLIKIIDDRLEVLIEFNEAPKSFIDIMVRFPKWKALDDALDFIHNKVIHNIQDFQITTGCWQGVHLYEVALRPSCVENLMMPEIKMKQFVMLEELTSRVLKSESIYDIQNVTYVWHSLEAASLGVEYTPIIELLGERHFASILAERVMKVDELSKHLGLEEHTTFSSQSNEVDEIDVRFEWPRRSRSLLRRTDASIYALESQMKGLEAKMEAGVQRIEARLDAIAMDIKDVKDAIGKLLEQKEKLMPRVQGLLTNLHNHKHVPVPHQYDDHIELPKFFLFNKDKTLISKLVPGLNNFRLSFMCESHPMPHLPPGQEGIHISMLDDGAVKSILPYMHVFLSTLALSFRLGAPIAQAFGFMIPDLTVLIDTLISESRDIVSRSKVGNMVVFDAEVMGKARIWLQTLMRDKGYDNNVEIQKRFGLMKKHLRDGRYAWLCDDHYRHAI